MNVRRMQMADVDEVAALHSAMLGGLLTRLGPRAVRAYYDACVQSALSIVFVAIEGTRVVGFVAGSTTPRALRSDIIQRNPIGFGFGTLLAGIQNPRAVVDLLRSTRSEPAYDTGAPELIYLAVDATQRKHGTGKALVRAFSDAIRGAGASRYELSAEERNLEAQAFYERLGFTRVGTYQEFGATQIRYALTLATPPA